MLLRWNRVYCGLYLAYVVFGMAGRWSGWQNGDQVWFVDAARHLLAGSWHIYDYRAPWSIPAAPPLGIAYTYTPLLALLLAPFVALADALGGTPLAAGVGGADELAYRLIALPMLVADVLAMEQLRRLVRTWRSAVDEVALFLGVLVSLGLAGLLLVSASFNHHEGLVLLFLLLTLRVTPRHLVWGGVWAGLTLAAKQTAVLMLIPIAAVLFWQEVRPGRGIGSLLAWGGTAAAVFAAFLLPPLLADPQAVVYAFVTQEQRLILTGAGLPGWIDGALAQFLGPASPAYAVWHARLIEDSNLVLLAVVLGTVLGAVAWTGRRGRPIGPIDSRLLALIAAAALWQVVLGKWIGSHYYALPLILVLLWDTVRSVPRWPLLGLAGPLAFRAIVGGLPLPGMSLPRAAFILALVACLAGLTLGAAFHEDDAVRPAGPPLAPAGEQLTI